MTVTALTSRHTRATTVWNGATALVPSNDTMLVSPSIENPSACIVEYALRSAASNSPLDSLKSGSNVAGSARSTSLSRAVNARYVASAAAKASSSEAKGAVGVGVGAGVGAQPASVTATATIARAPRRREVARGGVGEITLSR